MDKSIVVPIFWCRKRPSVSVTLNFPTSGSCYGIVADYLGTLLHATDSHKNGREEKKMHKKESHTAFFLFL